MERLPRDLLLKILGNLMDGEDGREGLDFGFLGLGSVSEGWRGLFGEQFVWDWLLKQLGFEVSELPYAISLSYLKEFCREVIHWHRNPTDIKCESFTSTEGTGRITLEGRDGKGLKLDGQIIVFDLPDCAGSVGRYFFHKGTRKDKTAIEELNKFRRKINNSCIHPTVPLSVQFKSFLNLFQPGKFRIRVQHNIILQLAGTGDNGGYYPYTDLVSAYGCEMLHFTQNPPIVNHERVEHYLKQIQQGKRPLLVILTAGSYQPYTNVQNGFWDAISFLLDGHHKLCAYYKAQVFPSALRIQNLDVLDKESVWKYVEDMNDIPKDYLSYAEQGYGANHEADTDEGEGITLEQLIEIKNLKQSSIESHFSLTPFE